LHDNEHRMAARGNVTSFPLPWEALYEQLENVDSDVGGTVDLPRCGEELADFVSVLLKSNDVEDPVALGKFVHQAIVRRHVVVDIIEKAKLRGHRAYRNLDLERVREKAAKALPEHGVPAEITKLLPLDDLLGKIQIQKNATPLETSFSA
jgi:hypothetical protein